MRAPRIGERVTCMRHVGTFEVVELIEISRLARLKAFQRDIITGQIPWEELTFLEEHSIEHPSRLEG